MRACVFVCVRACVRVCVCECDRNGGAERKRERERGGESFVPWCNRIVQVVSPTPHNSQSPSTGFVPIFFLLFVLQLLSFSLLSFKNKQTSVDFAIRTFFCCIFQSSEVSDDVLKSVKVRQI